MSGKFRGELNAQQIEILKAQSCDNFSWNPGQLLDFADVDYTKRAEPSEVVDALKRLE